MKRGDIYWCNIASRNDHVNEGLRPCVIVSNDFGNLYSKHITVIPITSKLKRTDLPTHVVIDNMPDGKSMVLCEQVATISKTAVGFYIRTLDSNEMRNLNTALLVSLGIL